ncbi:MAG: DUF3455 domain-containing protein [Pseudomonadota bacterium]
MIRSRCCLCLCLVLVSAGCNSPSESTPAANPTAAPPTSAEPVAPEPSALAPAPLAASVPIPAASSAPSETKFPKTPPELQVPPNSSLVLKARAKGVQIYECASKPDDAGAFGWKLKAPEADLFDDRGQKVVHHFAGPTWQATDGSSALGTVKAKADAPDPHAVPWLLLTTVSKGPGLFARVMHVQRLDTSGGKPPVSGCDAARAKAKAETRVPYEASYYFYSLTPGSK